MQAPDPWGERLPRKLGLASTVAVLVGSTIGSGIFRTPAVIAGHIDDVALFMAAWIAGGVVALAGALTVAELAILYPRSGGIYVYVREAFGKLPAFLFGWAELLILRPAAYGAIAVTSAEYLLRTFGIAGAVPALGPLSRAQLVAVAMIAVVAAVNRRGIEFGAIVQNVSTALKVAALLGLVALGLLLSPGTPVAESAAAAPETGGAFVLAMVAILWAYDGWCDVGFVSGEVRDPQRALPRVFILGTAAVVALYLAANLVYLRVIPLDRMAGAPLVAAEVASALIGPLGTTFVAAAVMVSTFGTLNGSMMTGPRVFYAMAEDRLFFERVGRVHPRYGTPSAAIVLSAALGIVFVSVRSFAELAEHFVIGIWPFYALSVAAVFVLRRKRPDLPRPYKTFGYPVVPLLFLAASVFLLANYAASQPWVFLADCALVLSGVPVFWLWSRRAPNAADTGGTAAGPQ
ncbi:APC family permease [Nannocystis radixulma]|uniref:Amino acid permease n=1 Tax=Nannocystis radixulma TaxID=2995305 RepID=A0ABT5BIB1_9BACT|nr:amino acid permease [Nannocystis radixulma]MDC0673842.1 amino acid permease [Nannocystis radixulma]